MRLIFFAKGQFKGDIGKNPTSLISVNNMDMDK